MLSQTSISRSRSLSLPSPSSMRRRIFSSQPEPSRHGVHWPQDSRWKKRVILHAARTTQVVSSITTTDAGPEHRAGLADRVLVETELEVLGAEPRRRDAAGDERLQLAAVRDPAAERGVVDQVAKGRLRHLELVPAGAVDPTGQGEEPRARSRGLRRGRRRPRPRCSTIQGRLETVSMLLTTVGSP